MSDILDKIDQICRICLLQQPLMHSLLDGTNYNQNISQLLAYFTTLEDEIICTLPQLLCNTCLERLGSAYTFKQDCKRADDILRKLFIDNEHNFDTKVTITSLKNENVSMIVNINDKDVKLEIKEEPSNEEIDFLDEEKDEDYHLQFEVDSNDSTSLFEGEDESIESHSETTIKTETESTETNPIQKRIRNRKKKYECLVCKKRFEDYRSLWRHKTRVHRYFSCYVCWLPFSNKRLLEKHEEEHQDKRYLCEEENCNEIFDNYRLWVHHKRAEHHLEKFLKCLECDESFESEKNWYKHIQIHIYNRYRCSTCEKKFSSNEELQTHTEANHPCNLVCPQCLKICDNQKALKRHMNRHGKGEKLVCEECGSIFPTRSRLTEHQRKHQTPKRRNKKYVEKKDQLCPLCGRTFNRPYKLRLHLLTHEGTKPFACDVCDFKTANKQNLANHKRTHTGERPYTCEVCGKSYSNGSYLHIHKRWHTGERPFKCSFAPCDKGFVTGKDLKVHERTHRGFKLYECDICFNSFTTLHYLKVHKKKHYNESK